MISLEVYHAGTDPENLKDFPTTVVFSISDKYTLRAFKCKKALEDRSQRILYNCFNTISEKRCGGHAPGLFGPLGPLGPFSPLGPCLDQLL